MNLSYEQVVAKIKENTDLKEEEINSSINAKLQQFSGLVSKEGAAHILANELGIKLIDTSAVSKLKIENIMVGMQNVEVLTKVLSVFPVRQFNSKGKEGQVGSAILGDETGNIRAVFWNEQANKLGFINKGDVLKINGVYVKENRNSTLELHFNNRSSMVVNPPGETVEAKEFKRENPRKRINEIADTDNFVEVFGTVVEVFDLRFYEVCDKCGKRSRPEEGKYVCPAHGAVTPNYSYVLNVFLDDGTAAVRTVFFRNLADTFLKKTSEELLAFREAPEAFEQIKNDALGSFIKITARVNKNEMFNRIELVASDVAEAKPEDAQIETPAATTPSSTKSPSTATTTAATETSPKTAHTDTVQQNNPESSEESKSEEKVEATNIPAGSENNS